MSDSPLHRSSRLSGSELTYLSKNIDRLLHVVSLYMAYPKSVSDQLTTIVSSCNTTSFYCNLCAFTKNITTSCQEWPFSFSLTRRNSACFNETRDSLLALLPTAPFPLQRELLYKVDILNLLLTPTLGHVPAGVKTESPSLLRFAIENLERIEVIGFTL